MAGEENVKGDIPGFQVLVARDGAPHFQRVGVHGVFRAGLLVFAVERVKEAVGPAVPVEPVEAAPDGEVLVPRAGVGNVPDEHVDVGLVGGHPRRVEVPDDGGRVDEVAPVEVVVVVQRVAKVDAVVARHVRRGRDHAAPGACLGQIGNSLSSKSVCTHSHTPAETAVRCPQSARRPPSAAPTRPGPAPGLPASPGWPA